MPGYCLYKSLERKNRKSEECDPKTYEIIDVLDDTNTSTIDQPHADSPYDTSIRVGYEHQADLSKLGSDDIYRLHTSFNQVWSRNWKIKRNGQKIFRLMFSSGASSQFDGIFLNKTKKNLVHYFENQKLNGPKLKIAKHN